MPRHPNHIITRAQLQLLMFHILTCYRERAENQICAIPSLDKIPATTSALLLSFNPIYKTAKEIIFPCNNQTCIGTNNLTSIKYKIKSHINGQGCMKEINGKIFNTLSH